MTKLDPRLPPIVFAGLALVADQVSKYLISLTIPLNTVGWSLGGDFFWLTHQRNTGVAFSFGQGWPEAWRWVFFIAVPVVVLLVLGVFYWRDRSLGRLARWGLALVFAGGLGNLIDRVCRADGVIDFLSFNFYGLLGLARFATFNLADSCVTVGGALLVLAWLFGGRSRRPEPRIPPDRGENS